MKIINLIMRQHQTTRLKTKRTNLLKHDNFVLTDEQYQLLLEDEKLYLKGEGKSYTREEAIQIAKGLRDF